MPFTRARKLDSFSFQFCCNNDVHKIHFAVSLNRYAFGKETREKMVENVGKCWKMKRDVEL